MFSNIPLTLQIYLRKTSNFYNKIKIQSDFQLLGSYKIIQNRQGQILFFPLAPPIQIADPHS